MKRIVKLLILSDFFIFSGIGLISPILAIFIKENLAGGSIAAAGIASMIFILTKSILQPTLAYIAQPKHVKAMLIGGTGLMVVVPIIYFFATHVHHIYLASFVYGLATATAYPPWFRLFTRNITKGREGLEWSIYSSVEGFGSAATAYIGAFLAEKFGFYAVFLIVASMVFVGFLTIIFIFLEAKKPKHQKQKNQKSKQKQE
jgi:DHA1 family quinolone resistance protein-like MFS transporter